MQYNMDEYVEGRLTQWAKWYTTNLDCGLGYPRRSLEARLIEEGGYLSKSTGYHRELNNPVAEDTEDLIREMAVYNLNLAKVIRAEYIISNTQANKAKQLGISLAQFKFSLKMAKSWLSGRLLANLNPKTRTYFRYQQEEKHEARYNGDLALAVS